MKPVTEGQILHDSTYKLSKIIRLREAEQDGGCQGLGRRGNGQLQSSGSNVSVTYITRNKF